MENTVSVFYSCDDRYIPFFATSLRSLICHADPRRRYRVFVLHNGLAEENVSRIATMQTENISVKFLDVGERIRPLADRLDLRDYYTVPIYFRLFIPAMFPELDKAVYLDSDTVLLADVAELYSTDVEGRLLAAAADQIIPTCPEFIRYAEEGIGVPYRRYFNSGVLVMNLNRMRACDIEGQFAYLLNTYRFDTVCPDQDYLNVICRGQVTYLNIGWNKMSIDRSPVPRLNLIHFNMFNKPWHYSDVPYAEYFWEYARQTEFYPQIKAALENFGDGERAKDAMGEAQLVEKTRAIVESPNNFRRILLNGEGTDNYEPEEFFFAAGQA